MAVLCVLAAELHALRKNGIVAQTQSSLELYKISKGLADTAENLKKIAHRLERVEREAAKLRPLFFRQAVDGEKPSRR